MLTKEICNNKHKMKPDAKLRIVLIAQSDFFLKAHIACQHGKSKQV